VKEKTKQGLSHTWGLPETSPISSQSSQQSLDLLVNISAPHILIPESVVNRDSLLLVIDFGHFHVTRTDVNCIAAELASTATEDDDEDEEYQTPCSTPPNEPVTSPFDELDSCSITSGPKEVEELSDKYNVHFSDLQLLVCRVKDNWKQAHLKGTSALHLLDRFSILIHVEKYDRFGPFSILDRPSIVLTASLPRLVAHINESKIHSLIAISKQFPNGELLPPSTPFDQSYVPEDDEEEAEITVEYPKSTVPRWIQVQFSVEQLSVELQSRGRSVAELQVGGFQASYSIRQEESAFHMAVHSLLLVDAMQTLGSDYELLIASHKHVW